MTFLRFRFLYPSLGVLALLWLPFVSWGQAGCMDPLSSQFDPLATEADTSCLYPITQIETQVRVATLPVALNETSGLLFTENRLFTLNDSGNEAAVFEMDTSTGQIRKKTRIRNFPNVDWEELCADSQWVYIGDFGNNNGNRTNLRILRVKKTHLFHPDSTTIEAEAIRFRYPEQTQFSSSNSHNFDCEAMVFRGGKLHLFTKNRGNQKTYHYSLPADTGFHLAELRDSLSVGGLITAASLHPKTNSLVLLGYGQSEPRVFIWLLFGFEEDFFFRANRRRIELPLLFESGQAEGISFLSDNRIWMSNEQISVLPAALRETGLSPFLNPFFTSNKQVKAKGFFPSAEFRDGTIRLLPSVLQAVRLHHLSGKSWLLDPQREWNTAPRVPGLYWIEFTNSLTHQKGIIPLRIP